MTALATQMAFRLERTVSVKASLATADLEVRYLILKSLTRYLVQKHRANLEGFTRVQTCNSRVTPWNWGHGVLEISIWEDFDDFIPVLLSMDYLSSYRQGPRG